MNYRIIAYIVGWVFNLQAIFMVLPVLTAMVYGEKDIFAFFCRHCCLPGHRTSSYTKEAHK